MIHLTVVLDDRDVRAEKRYTHQDRLKYFLA
jgi:hypothetical protein